MSNSSPHSEKSNNSQNGTPKSQNEKASKTSFFSRFKTSNNATTTKNSSNRTFTFNGPDQLDPSSLKVFSSQNLFSNSQSATRVAESSMEVPRFLYDHAKAELEQWKTRCKTLESENQELWCASLKYKSQFMNLHHELRELTNKFTYSSSQNDILERNPEGCPTRFMGFKSRPSDFIPSVKILEDGAVPINTEYFSNNTQQIEVTQSVDRKGLDNEKEEEDGSLRLFRTETADFSDSRQLELESFNRVPEGLELMDKRGMELSAAKTWNQGSSRVLVFNEADASAADVKIQEISDDSEELRTLKDSQCTAENLQDIVNSIIAVKYTPVINPPNPSILGEHAIGMLGKKHRPSVDFVNKSTKMQQELKLFEEFFVIGVERDDVLEFEKKNPSAKNTFLKPKILFNYPSESKNMQPPKSAIPDFCFPFGVEIIKEEANSDGQLLEIAFSKKTVEQNQNCFAFALKSEGLNKEHVFEDEMLKNSNSSKSVYQICIKTTDYIDLGNLKKTKDKKTKSRYYWKVTRVYCFMTHFPLVKFFMDLNAAILDTLKLERMKVFTDSIAKNKLVSNPNMNEIEGEFIKELFVKQLKPILHKIYSLPTPRFGSTLEIDVIPSEKIVFQVPERERAFSLEGSWACSLVFSYLPMADLLTLLSAMLLERKVVILSKNLALLSSFLMAFYTLIKPFTYPFPMIFMPSHLMTCLEAPCPLLVGINQGVEFLQKEQLHHKPTNCTFLLLENGKTFMFSDSRDKITEPKFKELRQSLPEIYKVFNEEENATIENGFDYLNGKESSPSPLKLKMKESNRFGRYLYHPNQQEANMSFKVVQAIYQTLQAQIVSHLPKEPIYLEEYKDLDYRAIGRHVINQNSEEAEFLKDFVRTQTFAFFIENHYNIS